MQQRSANDDALMTELLELAGWKIQRRDNGESLYIPGWSVASKAGYDWNLCDYTEGYDFFESKDDAIDHLAVIFSSYVCFQYCWIIVDLLLSCRATETFL